jgi:hypothetical protein
MSEPFNPPTTVAPRDKSGVVRSSNSTTPADEASEGYRRRLLDQQRVSAGDRPGSRRPHGDDL